MQPWVWGYGGGLIDPAKKQILIANSKSVAGVNAYKALFSSKCAFAEQGLLERLRQRPDGVQERPGRDDRQRPVVDGGHPQRPVVQVVVEPRRPRDPQGPGRHQGSPVGGNGFVIAKGTKNADAAYKLIDYLTSGPAQAALARRRTTCCRRGLRRTSSPRCKKNRLITAFLPQMKVATARPVVPQGGQIYADFGPNFQKVLNGQLSAKAAMLQHGEGLEAEALPGLHDRRQVGRSEAAL